MYYITSKMTAAGDSVVAVPSASASSSSSSSSSKPALNVNPDRVRRLPKVELHAHLGGSIKQDLLCTLEPSFKVFDCRAPENRGSSEKALQLCFHYFDCMNKVVSNLA